MAVPYVGYPDGTAYPTIGAGTSTVSVSSSAALTSALSAATAGQRILLASGTYTGTFTLSGKTGTSGSGISIEAATTGGAVFASGSKLLVDNSAHVTVKGLSFPFDATGDTIAIKGTSHHVRVTRCLIGPTSRTNSANVSNMIYAQDAATFLRIDHNELRNKGTSGNGIRIYGDFSALGGCTYVRIDHNYLHDFGDEVGNDKEPMRVGTSAMSRTVSNNVVERNHLFNCAAEPENVSCKLSNMRVTGNTIRQCAGGLVVRHGRNTLVADNYFIDDASGGTTASGGLKSGGYRFYDSGHTIEYNYNFGQIGTNYESAIIIDTGDAQNTGDSLSAHWRIGGATVRRNVLVSTNTGIRIGDNYSLDPFDVTLTDNVAVNTTSGAVVTSVNSTALGGSSTNSGNTYYASTGAAGMTQDSDGIWRKSAYGPRLTYMDSTDVGIDGDADDSDGTGRLVGASSLSANTTHTTTSAALATATAGTPGTAFVVRNTTAAITATAVAVPPVVASPTTISTAAVTGNVTSPAGAAHVTSAVADVTARSPSPYTGARTVIPPQRGRRHGTQIEFTSVDPYNGMTFPNSGRSILLIRNSTGSPITVTVWYSRKHDPAGHTQGKQITVPANTPNVVTAVFPPDLYSQPGGTVDLAFSAATGISVAVVEGYRRW